MKVKIGPYTRWVGPYQIAEALCFWVKPVKDEYGIESKPEWVHDFGTWLAERKDGSDTWLTKACNWIHKFKRRQEYVRIDRYDYWNADHTLSLIIAPLLVELKANKHGSGYIDDADVPEHLRSTAPGARDGCEQWDSDHNLHKRYEWFLDELIWAFTAHKSDDEQDQFYDHGEKIPGEDLMQSIGRIKVDHAGLDAHNARKQHAFDMFGKYFQTLWD